MDSRPACPLCDGFGLIDVPGEPGRVKRCPECDTPPATFPTLAELVGPPEEGEYEYWAGVQEARRIERRHEEECFALGASARLAGLAAGDNPFRGNDAARGAWAAGWSDAASLCVPEPQPEPR